mmetsp:Transcript_61560/g.120898  ORF Transcript_61560/g.120898 Transcript_61560/m.120898 type:complete len:363 (+) Transcript_61560:274-1362(+)
MFLELLNSGAFCPATARLLSDDSSMRVPSTLLLPVLVLVLVLVLALLLLLLLLLTSSRHKSSTSNFIEAAEKSPFPAPLKFLVFWGPPSSSSSSSPAPSLSLDRSPLFFTVALRRAHAKHARAARTRASTPATTAPSVAASGPSLLLPLLPLLPSPTAAAAPAPPPGPVGGVAVGVTTGAAVGDGTRAATPTEPGTTARSESTEEKSADASALTWASSAAVVAKSVVTTANAAAHVYEVRRRVFSAGNGDDDDDDDDSRRRRLGADVTANPFTLDVVTPSSSTMAALRLTTSDAVAGRAVPASSIVTSTPTAEAAVGSLEGCGVGRLEGFAVASMVNAPSVSAAPSTKFVRCVHSHVTASAV